MPERHGFSDIAPARNAICEWRKGYHGYRPHSTLNYLTPRKFAASWRMGILTVTKMT
ncbi:hypothetical protein EAH77_13715 [Ewingella americana]|uniref:Integrase catalytic domain-containing protein n=1 Tax=Ewingella americana TaxID=41202 RepID=A0A502GL19_9GAMM|nr:hypothetical protein EAH77_13715 [Ewingella americana]